MDYFLTTYAKDYKWPIAIGKKVDDTKEIEKSIETARKKFTEAIEFDAKPAEITPAQVGAPPLEEASKYDQPSTYLRKLYSKYPYLYDVMKLTPPAELAKKVYSEKYKSVYQEDFCERGFTELRDSVERLDTEKDQIGEVCTDSLDTKSAKKKKECACDHDTKYHPCTCAKDARPAVQMLPRNTEISKMPIIPREKEDKIKEKLTQETKVRSTPQFKPYRTEYKDTISKTGAMIIRKKLHYPPEEVNENK